MKHGWNTDEMQKTSAGRALSLICVSSVFDHWLRLFRRLLIMLVCIAAPNATADPVAAQTLEVQDQIAGRLEFQRESWLGKLKWAWRWATILDTEVDLTQLQGDVALKVALDAIYDQFAAKGVELDFRVDEFARFLLADLDENGWRGKCRIDLSTLPQRVTLGRLLVEMLEQHPQKNGTVVLHHTYLEITTTQAAAGRDRSFHVLRRAATVAKTWLLIATTCSLLCLVIRAPAVWRRSEGRLKGAAGLMARAALVFLFWPIWLTAVGIGLTRNRVA